MIIFHVDVNSAFLSWTALRLLEEGYKEDIRDIPSAIAAGDANSRRGIILAKSVPAKKYNIKTAETVYQAMRKCPQLQLFPPDFKTFHYHSDRMYELLLEYSPIVQRFSIDECFIDYTASQQLFGDPVKVAFEIKERIKNQLGFTVNVGVSTNKLLAKMASDFEKPDRMHTLFPEEIKEKMWPLPVSDLFMVGKSSAAKLTDLGINTIGELANTRKTDMEGLLKSHGRMIWEYANGIDNSEVEVNDSAKEKSIGNSTTLEKDVTTKEEAYKVLLWLAEKTTSRLRSQKCAATQVSVSVKDNLFKTYSHQMQVYSGVSTVEEVFFYAKRLFDEAWKGEPLRLMGISLGGLTCEIEEQMSLFGSSDCTSNLAGSSVQSAGDRDYNGDIAAGVVDKEKSQALEKAMDRIKAKFGEDAVKIASLSSPDKKRHL